MDKKSPKRIKRAAENVQHACSVTITCQEPNESGSMQVEMICEGDKTLVEYLLEEARYYLKEAQ